MVFDGIVLRGQSEGVPAHGEEHIIAFHPPLPGHDVHGGIGPGMAYMETLARRIGELHQSVILGLIVFVFRPEGLGLLPLILPFVFYGRVIILHFASSSFFTR